MFPYNEATTIADVRAIDWLDRYKGLAQRRDRWRTLWQNLADIFHPTRGGFTSEILEGVETSPDIYDSTPMQSRRALATAIDGLMKPSSSKWFWMKAQNEDLNEVDAAKRWFDLVGDRMWAAIYSPTARFIQQSGAVDNDIATFGLGYLWIDENKSKTGLSFRAVHISSVAIDENSDGVVDTACISRSLTARQAAQRWSENQLGDKVKEALRSTDPKAIDHRFKFVQCLYPRAERDVRMRNNGNMPIASLIVSQDDEIIIEESGYEEWPIAVPRWEVVAGQVYPRSPGMLALADSRTLQAMGRTLLVAGEKKADPPTWAVDDGIISALRTYPGGHTIVSGETVRDMKGPPLGMLETGGDLPIGREMQQDYRQMVGNAFYRDVLQTPDDFKYENVPAIEERKAQFLRTIAPTLGQLEPDYIGTVVGRVFGLMSRARAFPPPPPELNGQAGRFEFASPIQQAKRQIEAMGMARAFSFITPLAQVQPESMDNLDGDEIVRDMPEAFAFRDKWLKPLDQVQQIRAQRQQQQAAATAMAAAQHASQTGLNTAKINESLGQADQMTKQTALPV